MGDAVEYRPFGRTGVRVSPLTLGAMQFGEANREDGVRVIHRALDAGVNVVDTADVYKAGQSEQVVGAALAGRRDSVFLATKFHGAMGEDPNRRGNSRRWVARAVEDSLRRLGTDWIDLYQVHRPDPDTDFEETLSALTDLVRAGKIRYIGTSTFPASEVVEGQWTAERRGLARPVAEQPPYSILARGVEREVLPVAQRYGMAVLPWSPLAGGWLGGGYRRGVERAETPRMGGHPEWFSTTAPRHAERMDALDALTALADGVGIALAHLALAFVIRHPAVTSAIIGPRTVEHLEKSLGAVDVVLSDDVLDEIDRIVPPGFSLPQGDFGYDPPSISDASTRRR